MQKASLHPAGSRGNTYSVYSGGAKGREAGSASLMIRYEVSQGKSCKGVREHTHATKEFFLLLVRKGLRNLALDQRVCTFAQVSEEMSERIEKREIPS